MGGKVGRETTTVTMTMTIKRTESKTEQSQRWLRNSKTKIRFFVRLHANSLRLRLSVSESNERFDDTRKRLNKKRVSKEVDVFAGCLLSAR